MNEQLFAVWWYFKTKETNIATWFYLNILPWLNLLHFHQLVSFFEDRNAAIVTFSFFKGSSSQPTEGLVAIYYVGTILQSRKSLEILSGHGLRLLVGSHLFSSFDRLLGRVTSAPDQKFFHHKDTLLSHYYNLGWESICMMKK